MGISTRRDQEVLRDSRSSPLDSTSWAMKVGRLSESPSPDEDFTVLLKRQKNRAPKG